MYRGGRVSERMAVGAEQSRTTNRTAPFRVVIGMAKDAEGQVREVLECGHFGSYGFMQCYDYENRFNPAPDAVLTFNVLLGHKRRCKGCVKASRIEVNHE